MHKMFTNRWLIKNETPPCPYTIEEGKVFDVKWQVVMDVMKIFKSCANIPCGQWCSRKRALMELIEALNDNNTPDEETT